MPPHTDTLTLAPDGHTVKSATQWLEAIGDRENWSPALTFALTLSLDEALTNIVSYAFQITDDAGGNHRTNARSTPCVIFLRHTLLPAQVRIDIIDNGRPYDPTRSITPPLTDSLEHARLGGHGLRLIRHYVSEISYVRRDLENCLTLIADMTRDTK